MSAVKTNVHALLAHGFAACHMQDSGQYSINTKSKSAVAGINKRATCTMQALSYFGYRKTEEHVILSKFFVKTIVTVAFVALSVIDILCVIEKVALT